MSYLRRFACSAPQCGGLWAPPAAKSTISSSAALPLSPLRAFFASSVRYFSAQAQLLSLNNIRDHPGAKRKETRYGRGPGSQHGKTAGRGMNGARSRKGAGGQVWYEGGQTPLWRRIPRRGFNNKMFEYRLTGLNIGRLVQWIEEGRIDASQTITLKTLYDSNVVQFDQGVKLLAGGKEKLKTPVKLQLSDASAEALKAVESAGGSLEKVYFNHVTMRAHLKPERFAILPTKNATPPPRLWDRYPHLAPVHVDKRKSAQITPAAKPAAATAKASA